MTGDQRQYSDQIQTLKSYFVFPVALLAENSPRRHFSVFTISNKSLSMSNKLLSMSSKLFSMVEVLNIFYYNHSVYVYETCPASLVLQGLWWSVLGLPKLLSLSHGWYNTCMIKNQNISQRCLCTRYIQNNNWYICPVSTWNFWLHPGGKGLSSLKRSIKHLILSCHS